MKELASRTLQPTWKKTGTVGDENPIDYDGGFVYEDQSGVYVPELEYIQATKKDECGDACEWFVFRFALDRYETMTDLGKVLLVPYGFSTRYYLSHPIANYDEWFHRELADVAKTVGRDLNEFRADFCSANVQTRAAVFLDLAQYHGFENFDPNPMIFTSRESIEARYAKK
jgi:hypothetical protein